MGRSPEKRLRLQRLFALPPPPAAAQRLLEALADESMDAQALAKLLEVCPGISARIVGLANTAYYGTRPVYSLKEAIVRIGLNAVKGLALTILLSETLRPPEKAYFSLERHWLEALTVAACSVRLGKRLNIPEERAYLAGLLHNFGLLALVYAFPEAMSEILDRPPPWEELERERLGLDHHEAAAWILFRWHLPEDIVYAVEHCGDEDYRGEAWPLAHLVGFTRDWMALRFEEIPSRAELLGLHSKTLLAMAKACLKKQSRLADFAVILAGP